MPTCCAPWSVSAFVSTSPTWHCGSSTIEGASRLLPWEVCTCWPTVSCGPKLDTAVAATPMSPYQT